MSTFAAAPADLPLLDARGLRCPEPVMMLHKKVRELAAGDELVVWATDPSTQRDIPKFCQFLGHELLSGEERAPGEYHYRLRKGG
ncbi:sulfurtransferase TusA [Perlucidibaca piscinae]|uniref:sulfurtransferase TusA n=1 Tax=Perlucidibaca piscinae TaxID=392589 RepID=UPI0003B55765|nr:sulfurtransferase TusA [Perlucidibaca piscinae]